MLNQDCSSDIGEMHGTKSILLVIESDLYITVSIESRAYS
jgi:hypothetical protein